MCYLDGGGFKGGLIAMGFVTGSSKLFWKPGLGPLAGAVRRSGWLGKVERVFRTEQTEWESDFLTLSCLGFLIWAESSLDVYKLTGTSRKQKSRNLKETVSQLHKPERTLQLKDAAS